MKNLIISDIFSIFAPMISRCYLEITNICNLDCIFCPKTEREKHRLSMEDYELLTDRLQGEIQFLYFHLMGEPMLHPLLPDMVRRAREKGFVPVLTTNGTKLQVEGEHAYPVAQRLLEAGLHKLQISLHSQEGNGREHLELYVREVMTYALQAARRGVIVVLRLWNQGGYDSRNEELLELMSHYVPQPWTQRYDGWKLTERLYLEYDQMFEWPDEEHAEYDEEETFCYALRNQIGVLVDGTVVPCCLDHEGAIALGNLKTQSLREILEGERARCLYEGFSRHQASEPLCRRCGYAAVDKRFRKPK